MTSFEVRKPGRSPLTPAGLPSFVHLSRTASCAGPRGQPLSEIDGEAGNLGVQNTGGTRHVVWVGHRF